MAYLSINDFLGNYGRYKQVPLHSKSRVLELTPYSIHFGSEIFPINNLSRVGQYKLLEEKFPIFLIVLLSLIGLALFSTGDAWAVILGIIPLGIAIYGITKRFVTRKYAFGFEMNSGRVIYAYSEDIDFIGRMMESVTKFIESEDRKGGVVIDIITQHITNIENIEDRSITNTGFMGGDVISGDKTEGAVDNK
jgi:hypothetical protein